MSNITGIHDCFGCGVCATACTHKVIGINLNKNGFYEPYITAPESCTDCGLCREVCAYVNKPLAVETPPIGSYAAWSNDTSVRKNSTSGGIAYELGKYLLTKGYKVCAVRYNAEKGVAEHYIANSQEELTAAVGSKYIQSYTCDGFSAINRKDIYFVVGTPCQIDSFRRYIQKFHCEENFILLDFFCHGVPSMLAWQKYTKWAEKKIGKIRSVTWRNKDLGWRHSYNMHIEGGKGILVSPKEKGDMFLNMFLSDCCLGPQCHKACKYKYIQSSADIRIGDFWGKTYKTNKEGVNSVLCFSHKGLEVLQNISCTLVEHPLEIVTEEQIRHNSKVAPFADKVWASLLNPNHTINQAAKYSLRQLQIRKWKGRINHLLRIIHVKYQIK